MGRRQGDGRAPVLEGEGQPADSREPSRIAGGGRDDPRRARQEPALPRGRASDEGLPSLFNRYTGGQSFGTHVDNAIRQVPGTANRIRADISATLFFAGPEEYDGGELIVQDTYGAHSVKLRPGSLVLYPATSLHHVTPVTRGARLCSFFWIQSMIRDDGRRSLLFDMDVSLQRLSRDVPGHASIVPLTGVYHNLLRQWAEI